jgi:hypothetical protein
MYELVMTGQTYPDQQGVNNLCYRGDRYTLDEVVPSGPMSYKVGVINLNMDTQVQLETPDEVCQDDDGLTVEGTMQNSQKTKFQKTYIFSPGIVLFCC